TSRADSPVRATILRIPLLTDSSAVTANPSMSPVFFRCVPPQNSTENCRHLSLAGSLIRSFTGAPIDTTRTIGGYFFAEDGPKPVNLQRLFLRRGFRVDRQLLFDALVDERFDLADLFVAHRLAVREIEAEFLRIDQ